MMEKPMIPADITVYLTLSIKTLALLFIKISLFLGDYGTIFQFFHPVKAAY